MLYKAQEFFPVNCRDCPMLVGLIEDGYIDPSENVTKADVMIAFRDHKPEYNFEACPGPKSGTNGNNQEWEQCSQFPLEAES